jgi:hypothetical protein
VRIKTLFNFALDSVGEFAARALEIARDFVLGLLCGDVTTASSRRRTSPGLDNCFARPEGEAGLALRWWSMRCLLEYTFAALS